MLRIVLCSVWRFFRYAYPKKLLPLKHELFIFYRDSSCRTFRRSFLGSSGRHHGSDIANSKSASLFCRRWWRPDKGNLDHFCFYVSRERSRVCCSVRSTWCECIENTFCDLHWLDRSRFVEVLLRMRCFCGFQFLLSNVSSTVKLGFLVIYENTKNTLVRIPLACQCRTNTGKFRD